MRHFPSRTIRQFGVSIASKAQFNVSRNQNWDSKNIAGRMLTPAASKAAEMDQKSDYTAWSHESLVERVTHLEKELKSLNQSLSTATPTKKTWKKVRTEGVFDPAKYTTRLVAFKVAYLGKRYNGYEHNSGDYTPLPTIEEELFKALHKARLIFPAGENPLQPREVRWEGTDYTKCGRTDKGVSAFGQVIGIRVRSNRPVTKLKQKPEADAERDDVAIVSEDNSEETLNAAAWRDGVELADPVLNPSGRVEDKRAEELHLDDPDYENSLNFDPIKDEIPYCRVLNRLLPPDIRILAWCPSPPPDFSARFSCRERRYRYFFTQPAFSPVPDHLEAVIKGGNPSVIKSGWLDIGAMQEAAKAFEGTHDFRNFCKVDASKQISNFERTIFQSRIEEVEDHTGALSYINGLDFRPAGSTDSKNPKIYTFNLHGSAFLWHQVRHMVAILFLVGQGLEQPSIVSELLDVKKNPARPTYEMATDTPLVLWECIFPREGDEERKDAMQWLYVGDGPGNGDTKYENSGLMDVLWKNWRERKIDEMLAGALMGIVANQGSKSFDPDHLKPSRPNRSQKVFDGGDIAQLQGKYKPVMEKPRMESVEKINEKYAVRKGFENTEDLKGYRSLKFSVPQ